MDTTLIAKPVVFHPASTREARLAAQRECIRIHAEWIAQLRQTLPEARRNAMRWPRVEHRVQARTQAALEQSAAAAQAERRVQKISLYLRQRAALAAVIRTNSVLAAQAVVVNGGGSIVAAAGESAGAAISSAALADDRRDPCAARADGTPATARSGSDRDPPAAGRRPAPAVRVTPPSSSTKLRVLLAKLVHRALRAGQASLGGQMGV